MTKGIHFVQTVRQRGELVAQAYGRTGRGTKYLIKQVPIAATSIHEKDFKVKQDAAVAKLFESEA